MAWFKQAADAEAQCRPVTLERIEEIFHKLGFTYDRSEDAILSGFDGFPVMFVVTPEGNILSLYISGSDFNVPAERYSEVVSWANHINGDTFLGVFYAMVTEEEKVDIRLDISAPVGAGLNDDQLELYMSFFIQAGLEIMGRFAEEFGLAMPGGGE